MIPSAESFALARLRERLWVKPLATGMLSVAAAFVADRGRNPARANRSRDHDRVRRDSAFGHGGQHAGHRHVRGRVGRRRSRRSLENSSRSRKPRIRSWSTTKSMSAGSTTRTDPPGFKNSALPSTVHPVASEMRRSLMSGVPPMAPARPSRTSSLRSSPCKAGDRSRAPMSSAAGDESARTSRRSLRGRASRPHPAPARSPAGCPTAGRRRRRRRSPRARRESPAARTQTAPPIPRSAPTPITTAVDLLIMCSFAGGSPSRCPRVLPQTGAPSNRRG
jgi:hypothetical protein